MDNNKGFTLNDDSWEIQDGLLINYNGEDSVVIIPPGVTEIDVSAIMFEEAIETIIVPDTVKKIGYAAFDALPSLKTLYLPDNGAQLSNSFINGCTNLKEVYLGEQKLEFVTATDEDDKEFKHLVTYVGGKSDVVVPDGYRYIDDEIGRAHV